METSASNGCAYRLADRPVRLRSKSIRDGCSMTKMVGVAGSLRQGSFNRALLRAAAAAMPEGTELVTGAIDGIPLYNADIEARDGLPAAVTALKAQIADADGLLLVTPEYNNSIPGVFKNAIDWLSRPPADIPWVFGGRRVALIGASPGGFGTVLSQAAWLPVLKTLGTELWSAGKLLVSHAGDAFDAEGRLVDERAREQLGKFLQGFVAFVAAPR